MSLARNISTTLAARVVLMGLALASSIALARLLGPEGRGVFALVLLLPDLVRTFGTFGFDQANTVYAGLEASSRRALVWHSTMVAGLVGGVVGAVAIAYLAFGGPGSHTLLRGPLWLYLLPLSILPAALAADHWAAVVRGMNRIAVLNALDVGMKVASLALVLMLVGGLGLGVAGAVWADATATVGTAVVVVFVLCRVGLSPRPRFDLALWKRTTRLALPAHFSAVMAYLNYRVDQFFVAAFLPPDQLAYYVIAVGLAERLWIVTGAVSNPLLPHLTNSPDRDPALAAVVARHVLAWTAAAALVVLVLADVVVPLLYSSAYAQAVAPFRWLLLGMVTLSVGKILVGELLAREKIMYTIWASIATVATNVVGNLVLIPRLGISGAAIASTISYTLLSAIVIWYYLRETGVSWTVLVPRPADVRVYGSLGLRALQTIMPGAIALARIRR